MSRTIRLSIVITLCATLCHAQVTLEEDDSSYTLANGIVAAKVSKRSGDLISLQYKGFETLTAGSGHPFAYWSHDAQAPEQVKSITIDPKTNGGERGEVSIKAISNGRRLGRPAGLAPNAEGDFPADIEIRYALVRGDSGVYTYCIFEHRPEYPAGSMGEARFVAKLDRTFDWISVDATRNKHYPDELPGEDKYVYAAVQSENPAFGWSSTKHKIGWWLINPSMEYMSGGPMKTELLCHQASTVLNYWRSSHYGGAVLPVDAGEHWTKVVGPLFLYVNSDGDPQQLWQDARARAEIESRKWPYDWVSGVDYPHRDQRSTVSGQLVLNDPLMPGGAKFAGRIMVGLTAAPYLMTPTTRPSDPTPAPREITWQTDARHYQFWARSDDPGGKFNIPNVRPGKYTLYAFADGILGEFRRADITIEPGGKPVELGQIEWTPVRRGRQLWEVGVANRTATEFAGADQHFEPGRQLEYAKLFPNDVNYVIGRSEPSKDWFFMHVPHNEDPNSRVAPFVGVRGNGRETPFIITFDLPGAVSGTATLRLGICAASTRVIDVSVNGKPVGQVPNLLGGDSTLVRHGIQGVWYEREVAFDASLMKPGENTLTLTVPAGPLNNGVIYDYVRLELDESP